jgi:hypothetical protein
MPLHSILATILAEYTKAKIEPFGGNPPETSSAIRPQMRFSALADLGAGLTVEWERWRWQLGGGALDFCI